MKRRLGNLERQLFAYTQLRDLDRLRTGDLVDPLEISPKQERELLARLSRAGMIAQVRRGLYLVPKRLPLGGSWSPDESLAIAALMKDRGASYQICGPNAFQRYGFDTQVPTRVYLYNDRISGERQVGAVALSLIKVEGSRLGDREVVDVNEGRSLVYSSRSRTLLDAIYDWSRFDGLPRAYRWIEDDLTAGRIKAKDLVATTLSYGNLGSRRRMGVLLERLGVTERLLMRLENSLTRSSSFISWIPVNPKRGRTNSRWGVVINE